MARHKVGRPQLSTLILIWCELSIITSQEVELDLCSNEKNCSIQLSKSVSLQCIVGHRKECDNVKLVEAEADQNVQVLYPYLSTIGIYKRYYHEDNDFQVDAFNFSFTTPQAEISEDSLLGVMAEFSEAPGYANNSYYKEPICRFFNFSRSTANLLNVFGSQEIPYNCIGINIYPSVFHLTLVSVPWSHRLNYVISWHEHPYSEDDYIYDLHENQGQITHKSVWAEQIIAVAVVESNRMIHAVFQLPRPNSGAMYLTVALVTGLQVIMLKQVGLHETSIKFTDVPPGQYTVVVQPQGGVCDLDTTLCNKIASELVSMKLPEDDDVTDSSTPRTLIVVMSAGAVIIPLVILGIVVLLMIKMHRRKAASESNDIYISSLACRHLEKHVTSYFCSFLSVALHTSVTFTFPLLHPGKVKVIKSFESTNEENVPSAMLLPSTPKEKRFNCCIILQFSYSGGYSYIQNLLGKCEGQLLITSGDSKEYNLHYIEDTFQKIPSKQAYYVTFKQGNVSSSEGIAYTIHEGSVNSVNTEDQITILNGITRMSSCVDTISQRTDVLSRRIYNKTVKEYLLPCDINELLDDLRSGLGVKTDLMSNCDLNKAEYWQLVVTVFRKAAEQQPNHSTLDRTWQYRDGVRTQTHPHSDFSHAQENQERHDSLKEYTSHCCHDHFSPSPSHIKMSRSDDSFIAPFSFEKDTCSSPPACEINSPLGLLQTLDHTVTRTPEKYHFWRSTLLTKHGSSCSCESYSNLTDAESDMERQACVERLRDETCLTQV